MKKHWLAIRESQKFGTTGKQALVTEVPPRRVSLDEPDAPRIYNTMIKFSSGNDEGVPSDFRALRSDTVKRCYDLLPPFTVENVSPILAICAPPTLGRTAVLHPLHNSLESGHIRRVSSS
ncbi:hypothetical protein GN244_ATG02342 [Phytophthora infestans]|uniref:Uncharacterized protein n=1 Tax=Phytophthora infestans TaxID=4787 RepID=A0A833T2V5_PHYIN|nr:hypothetical protein GN244_ATG02342 [Phytophthora infestans]